MRPTGHDLHALAETREVATPAYSTHHHRHTEHHRPLGECMKDAKRLHDTGRMWNGKVESFSIWTEGL